MLILPACTLSCSSLGTASKLQQTPFFKYKKFSCSYDLLFSFIKAAVCAAVDANSLTLRGVCFHPTYMNDSRLILNLL